MTLRLDDDQASDLDTVAAVDGIPVAEVVRVAIAAHIEGRKRDAGFQAALKARIERDQRLLSGEVTAAKPVLTVGQGAAGIGRLQRAGGDDG